MLNLAVRMVDTPLVPDHVIRYFMRKTSIKEDVARDIFAQLEKYLITVKNERVPSTVIDEAWHCFILHTKEYHKYCFENIGRFIHHLPDEVDERVGGSCSGCSSNCSGGD